MKISKYELQSSQKFEKLCLEFTILNLDPLKIRLLSLEKVDILRYLENLEE